MVRAQMHLMDTLGIQRLFSVAGGSMGGMQALQWAVDYPDRVETVLFLASLAGIDLTFGQQLMVVYLAILGGIGTAGVPSGSIPFVAAILEGFISSNYDRISACHDPIPSENVQVVGTTDSAINAFAERLFVVVYLK